MERGMRLMWLLVLMLVAGAPAAAQDRGPETSEPQALHKLVISNEAIARALAEERPMIVQQEQRDSLANGAIIGAIVGGVAMGAFGAWICVMTGEEGDPPCWRGILTISALGVGIGAAAGVGIDALAARRTPIPLIRVRF